MRAPVLVFGCRREGTWWVAQCLSVDLATQAKTLEDLAVEVPRLVEAHYTVSKKYRLDRLIRGGSRRPARSRLSFVTSLSRFG